MVEKQIIGHIVKDLNPRSMERKRYAFKIYL